MSNSRSNTFTVYMYEQEKHYLEWLVLQRQHIETGGDLFGLWRSTDTAIVQLIIGPGKRCYRTQTSFFQDINYLSTVGKELTSSYGLCNIGEWHSHHRIDLASPSQGDQTTVWKHMDSVSGGRFLVFIASITGSNVNPIVNIGCFMFSTDTKIMSKGSLVSLRGDSPIRGQFNDVSLKPGPEQGVGWVSFRKAGTAVHNPVTYISAEGENRSREPLERNQNKLAPPHDKDCHRQETHNKNLSDWHRHDNTAKTKLISAPKSRYGSTQTKQKESESIVNKSPTKKASKTHSNPGAAITTQPDQRLKDVVSPICENETKKPSIFDCCNACIKSN